VSTRDEFESWRQHKLAELTRERDELSTRRQFLEAKSRDAQPLGAAGEEIAQGLEAFLQRQHCVEGTLEMVRRGAPRSAYYDEVLFATRADGRPDTFFNFRQEPFARRARQLLEDHDGDSELRVRVDLSARSVESAWVKGHALQLKRALEEMEKDQSELDRKIASFRDMGVSTEPFGPELAWRVVRALKKGGGIHHSHRDYCGMGLFAEEDGGFVYASVWDGGFFENNVVRRFKDEEQLARWLAQQSDASLSNYGNDFGFLNQTLTRKRLEAFAPV
jgi:hypothetical protein